MKTTKVFTAARLVDAEAVQAELDALRRRRDANQATAADLERLRELEDQGEY